MLYLTCNSVEVLRLRHLLSLAVLQTSLHEDIYKRQTSLLKREGIVSFKDPFNFQTFIELGENHVNFVDEGPGSHVPSTLAIDEFDPSLRSHINFADPDSFKMMISPMGLEELRVCLIYQLANLQTLIVATKTNQILMDNCLREIAEIDLFIQGQALPNPTYNYFARLQGS